MYEGINYVNILLKYIMTEVNKNQSILYLSMSLQFSNYKLVCIIWTHPDSEMLVLR